LALKAYATVPTGQAPEGAHGLVTSLERAHLQAELSWLQNLLREGFGPGGHGW
jgi:hypothetical protein